MWLVELTGGISPSLGYQPDFTLSYDHLFILRADTFQKSHLQFTIAKTKGDAALLNDVNGHLWQSAGHPSKSTGSSLSPYPCLLFSIHVPILCHYVPWRSTYFSLINWFIIAFPNMFHSVPVFIPYYPYRGVPMTGYPQPHPPFRWDFPFSKNTPSSDF